MLAPFRAFRFAALVALVWSANLVAQSPKARLHDALVASARAPLPATREPLTVLGTDTGPLDPKTGLEGVTLVFTRSPEQESDLQNLLTAQLDPASPSFHAWLTPAQFGARFGMAESDLEAATIWLQSFGLTVSNASPSHDRLTFSGTVAQINAALGTELHHYQLNGEIHFAPAHELALPAPLAALTGAVENLTDLKPEPMFVLRTALQPQSASGASAASQPSPQPSYTTATTGQHLLTPGDLSVYYNLTPVLSAITTAATPAIAVVGQSAYAPGAVSSFQNLLGTNSTPYNVLLPATGVFAKSPGNETEAELDLEYASTFARQAQIYYVTPGDDPNHNVFDSVVYAIQQDIAPIITISYGECETLISSASLDAFNGVLMQAAAQGQTVITAAGDSGSTACARYTGTTISTAQIQAPAVGFPASSPWVTSIGGTQMSAGTFTAGDTTYWSTANGAAYAFSSSLRAYTPETVWNEGSPTAGILASGGGSSAHFPRPTWQTGVPGLPAGTFRLIPDLSLQASINNPGFLLCIGDPRAIGFTAYTSCTFGFANASGGYVIAGGTSFGAPAFAGMVAVLDQATGTLNRGLLNPALYAIAAQPSSYASAFHDIQTGSNSCVPGATNCSAQGQSDYPAAAGFDLASGLGTPNMAAIKGLLPPSSSQAGKDLTTVTIPTQNLNPTNSSITLDLAVTDYPTGSTTTSPTGTLSVAVDGQVVQPALAIAPGSPFGTSHASFTGTIGTAAGSHLVQVIYSGDATHAASRATLPILNGTNNPSGTIAIAVPNLSIATGANGTTTTVTVTPSAGYHGRVYWSLAYTTASGNLTACYIVSPLLVTASGTSSTSFTINTGAACTATTSSYVPGSPRASRTPQPHLPWRAGATAIMAGLFLCLLPRKRRQLPWLACLLLLTLPLATTSLSGCGSSQTAATTSPAQPVAPAPTVVGLALTAHDSVNANITATSSFTLTVN